MSHAVLGENKFFIFNRLLEEDYTFTWLIQMVSFVQVFVESLKQTPRDDAKLSVSNLQSAEIQLIKWSQERSFEKEMENLLNKKPIHTSSKLSSLSPFVDGELVIRVGGRIKNAAIDESARHPVLLSGKCELSRRIVKEYHLKGLHAGPSLLISTVRQKFWITGIRQLARSVVFQCIVCFKRKQRTAIQFMGDLPPERVNLVRPFLKVGVDYAGPMTLRATVGRGERRYKAYVVLFVCLSTKAVHIELVHDLTTDAFMAAFRRFVSRRGLCTDVFSDNGTNFVGCNNQLVELYRFLDEHSNEIYFSLLKEKVSWHFIPPATPHFGGLWEAAVKSMKFHLQRVIGETVLTFEEMNTLLCQVEAMMNSRPICGVQGDNDVVEALTPAHFLIGHPMTYLPERDLKDDRISPAKRWKLVQKIAQHYWKRWHLEYLTSLQGRYKWKTKSRNVETGDLVMVHEDNIPPTKWIMGRVIETFPGADQLVRVVKLQTKLGVFKRPIHKLSVLPMTIEPEDSRRPECLGEHDNI